MSSTSEDNWSVEPSNNYSAEIIGWRDIDGHTHSDQPKAQDAYLDGLIVRVTNKDDAEDTKVISVYKVSEIPDLDEWLRNIEIIAGYYGFELVYE